VGEAHNKRKQVESTTRKGLKHLFCIHSAVNQEQIISILNPRMQTTVRDGHPRLLTTESAN